MNDLQLTPEEEKYILDRRAKLENKKLNSTTLHECLRNYPTISKVLKVLHLPSIVEFNRSEVILDISPVKINDRIYLKDYSHKKNESYYHVNIIRYKITLSSFLGLSVSKSLSMNDSIQLCLTCCDNHVLNVSYNLFGVNLSEFFSSEFKKIAHVSLKVSDYRKFYYFALEKAISNYRDSIETYCNIFLNKTEYYSQILSFFSEDKKALKYLQLNSSVKKVFDFVIKNKIKKVEN